MRFGKDVVFDEFLCGQKVGNKSQRTATLADKVNNNQLIGKGRQEEAVCWGGQR